MSQILIIALPTPLRKTFEYLPPKDASEQTPPQPLQAGIRVHVPFGKQKLIGILINVTDEPTYPIDKLRHALKILDRKPTITSEIMDLCLWAAEYYQYPIGETLQAALPVKLRKNNPLPTMENLHWTHTTEGKGLPEDALKRSPKQQQLHQLLLTHKTLSLEQLNQLGVTKKTALALQKKKLINLLKYPPTQDAVTSDSTKTYSSNELNNQLLNEPPQTLNSEQLSALNQIIYHSYNTYMLEGTTGSGKTEVYLHAIARTLQSGNQALVLVPEIGLAPQTMERFRKRFKVNIIELHSHISQNQRTLNWMAALSGKAKIIIGTRLSIFTPMPQLGIIIIDEEHDLSFKQQDGLRYSARDLAVMRAYKKQIPLLMGSATPSLESLHNATIKKSYRHLTLTKRAGNASAPTVNLVDMKKQHSISGIAESSLSAIKDTLKREEQVLVFINRRGFAPALICHQCGWVANCHYCDAKLTLHTKPYHLCCHHCNRQQQTPTKCPSCHSPQLQALGQGTERCEEALQTHFPNNDVIRVDQDSMQRKNAMKDLYSRLNSGAPCILIGTQMLAKGHHFPKVTLVVLLDLDQGLFSGDFRGLERMSQQIVQVSGRSGRSDHPGQVILQTFQPEHPMLQLLLSKGYNALAKKLLNIRSDTNLPPTTHMAILRAESKRMENAIEFLKLARSIAQQICPPSPQHQYLGPIPAILERRNERYRYQLQIKHNHRTGLQILLKTLLMQLEGHTLSSRVRWSIDVDPQDIT